MSRWLTLVVVALLWASPAQAEPIGIHVLSAQYTTVVAVNASNRAPDLFPVPNQVTESFTSVSTTPIEDLIELVGDTWAFADADLFAVTSRTDAAHFSSPYRGRSWADANTEITFAPMQDGIASLDLTFLTGNSESFFTNGMVSLFDVTLNQALWTYQTVHAAGNVPWPDFGCCTATVSLDQELWASHTYTLTMLAGSDASTDSMKLAVNISGLYRVPEPSTLLLVGLGLAILGRYRRSKP